MNDILYIVIPAYNESANIVNIIDSWYGIVEKHNGNRKSRLVIINDGSSDDTFLIASDKKNDYPLLEVLNKNNSGHGATVLFGYNYALENNADFIFQTDSDGQTNPNEFESFWEERNNYDMVIGYRNNRKDGFQRIFVTKVLKLILALCFKVNVLDANTPYRLLKNDVLKTYIKYIPKDFNLSNVMLTVILTKARRKIKYIPITFKERQGGVNSINMKRIIGIGVKAIKDFIIISKNLSSL